jgi:simple sugar transport system ATP-binding protein/ribose transport system ATP-binding protein
VSSELPSVHVELRGISKRFGGVKALKNVDLVVERGAIHALVGENGAGKSTLGKIIAGIHRPDEGTLLVDGRPVDYRHPSAALRDGLAAIAQELTLVPSLSVIENVFLGLEATRATLLDGRALRRRYAELEESTGFGIPGEARVSSLRVAEQQKVEIMRALARDAKLIVMDEPTAALTQDEAERLFEVIRRLRDRGTTIIYVSHFLHEVLALADTVTVLRDGVVVQSTPAATQSAGSLVSAMLGRSLDLTFPAKNFPPADAPFVLSVRGLARAGVVNPTDLDVRAGEIVGIAGLIGSGRSELARLIFGADRASGGRVEVDGREVRLRRPSSGLQAGIALLPESRKEQGLLMQRSIGENITLPHLGEVETFGIVSSLAERRQATAAMRKFDVRAKSSKDRVATLSGGNQQKVLFAKWLFARPRVLIADEPTRGVDVGAKRSIYELIHSLAEEGLGILMISSEIEEVIGLAHRVLVMRGGSVVAEFDGQSMNEDLIMQAAFGATAEESGATASRGSR